MEPQVLRQQVAHFLPNDRVKDGGPNAKAPRKIEEARLQVVVVAGEADWIIEHPHHQAGADDMDIEDGHVIAAKPIPRDP